MKKVLTTTTVMGQSRKTISTDIIIEASSQEVWNVISDNSNWKNWNPFMINSSGTIAKGKKLQNTLQMTDKTMEFKPRILEYTEGKSFTWMGRFIMPGIVDGKHSFEVIPLEHGKVKFIQYEKFSGILSGTMVKKYGTETKENFTKMNVALKIYVESKKATATR